MSKDKKSRKLLTSPLAWFIIALALGIAGAFLHFANSEGLMVLGGFMIAYSGLILLLYTPLAFAFVIGKIGPHVVRDYFDTDEFLAVKADAKASIEDYNAMCDYVNAAKKEYYSRARMLCSEDQLANSTEIEQGDSDIACMKREIRCDKNDYMRAKESCFEFLFELLDIEDYREVLPELIAMSNAWFVANECNLYPLKKMLKVINEFYWRVPFRIRFFAHGMLDRKLGFCKFKNTQIETFKIVITCDSKHLKYEPLCIELDMEFLKSFISYSAKRLRKQGRDIKPIFLVTDKMMKDILKRDNNSCLLCGASKEKDETLFLELEYIEPDNPDAHASSDRIRTVCWKCKRDGVKGDFAENTAREL